MGQSRCQPRSERGLCGGDPTRIFGFKPNIRVANQLFGYKPTQGVRNYDNMKSTKTATVQEIKSGFQPHASRRKVKGEPPKPQNLLDRFTTMAVATTRSSAEELKSSHQIMVENSPGSIEAPKPAGSNGLFAHQQAALTSEEVHAEKKFRLKIDLIILPLIATVYFLAALAGLTPGSPRSGLIMEEGTLTGENYVGPKRCRERCCCGHGQGSGHDEQPAQLLYCLLLRRVPGL